MSHWGLFACALACALAHAQQEPRKAADYPVRAKLGAVTIAAENMGHAIPDASGGYSLPDFIAIDIGVYSDQREARVHMTHQHFTLRLNGKTILAASPGDVAASVKFTDWDIQRRLEVEAGTNEGGVILGRPVPTARFPGDRRPTDGRVPNPAPVENPMGKPRAQLTVDEIVQQAILKEGEVAPPLTGCIFFYYRGKLKSIKKLELLYSGPLGEAVLTLP